MVVAVIFAGFPLCWRTSPLMPDIAGEIVGNVGHTGLHRCPFDANGANEEPHLRFLADEDMLEKRANL